VGISVRSLAFAWDYLVIAAYLAVLVAGGAALQRFWPALSNAVFGGPIAGQVASFLLLTLPVTLYFALSEASARQATWGKRRMGLKVSDREGRPLSRRRSFGRTALKFVPWELTHTCIWQVSFAVDQSAPVYMVGFSVTWLLIGANVVSLLVSPAKQTIYDRLAGTLVRQAG
jgi:uncharacterized RDD family membrane protein YckC